MLTGVLCLSLPWLWDRIPSSQGSTEGLLKSDPALFFRPCHLIPSTLQVPIARKGLYSWLSCSRKLCVSRMPLSSQVSWLVQLMLTHQLIPQSLPVVCPCTHTPTHSWLTIFSFISSPYPLIATYKIFSLSFFNLLFSYLAFLDTRSPPSEVMLLFLFIFSWIF